MRDLTGMVTSVRADLVRLPRILDALLGDLEAVAWRERPAPAEWSPLEIVCHLRDEEAEDFGTRLRVVVDGDRLVSAEPPNAIVFRGASCDEMLFFSSQEGVERWKRQHEIQQGKVFSLAEAVERGATGFGKLTEGLPD